MPLIIPALLSEEEKDLKQQLRWWEGYVPWLQIDVVDGKFAPSSTLALKQIQRSSFATHWELHLMVNEPQLYLDQAARLGVERLIFSLEVPLNWPEFLSSLRQKKWQIGLALKPQTPLSRAAPFFNQIDLLLLLGVEPGFKGQKINLPPLEEKLKQLHAGKANFLIEIDGGVKKENLPLLVQEGADQFAVGSALAQAPQPRQAWQELQKIAQQYFQRK